MAGAIRPLTNSQKLFLQRLMAAHVLAENEAEELYTSIRDKFANVHGDDQQDNVADQGYMGNDLDHCLGIINGSLVPAFNLEICTVSLPPLYNPNHQRNHDESSPKPKNDRRSNDDSKRPALVRYHAVVNRSNDTIAQQYASPVSHGGPHEMAYIRLVLEKLVERGIELIEEDLGGRCQGGVGCPGVLNRMDLINLRTEMAGVHKDKLTIGQTEAALEMLERQGWLVQAAPPLDDDDDDEEENEDGEEDGEKQKKKRKRQSFVGRNRRKSLHGTFFGIGPRSFMELGDFLQKVGFPQDRMPQSIFHRV